MTDRLGRVDGILEVLAIETLANTRSTAANAQAIAQLVSEMQQLKRAVDYLISCDG